MIPASKYDVELLLKLSASETADVGNEKKKKEFQSIKFFPREINTSKESFTLTRKEFCYEISVTNKSVDRWNNIYFELFIEIVKTIQCYLQMN